MPFWLLFICVIIGVTLNDIVWTLYIRFISEGKKWPAAIAAMGITIGNAFVITNYVHNPVFILACVIGAFFGIVIPMTYKEWKDRKTKNGKKPG